MEDGFLQTIKEQPDDEVSRLVYADWLDDQDDKRGAFLRLHVLLRQMSPDHPHRVRAEHELSLLRRGIDTAWLSIIEPDRAHLTVEQREKPLCACYGSSAEIQKTSELPLHSEPQDTECEAWKKLLFAVEEAASDEREVFEPLADLEPHERAQIVTLPGTISKLKAVKLLELYGSSLVRIPTEISEMTALEEIDPYTSYRLHWYPYEITHCKSLRSSRVSTRALYGNYKNRAPFPRLSPAAPTTPYGEATRNCSVCGRSFVDRQLHRVWISLLVATDVLPLLVNACSADCIQHLLKPPTGYVQEPHRGGLEVPQPPPRW
jgi:uncharacterized protein (TIGR02996 family)